MTDGRNPAYRDWSQGYDPSVWLDRAVQATRTAVISGSGGSGKTSLAMYWAQQHLDYFPDGGSPKPTQMDVDYVRIYK